ncbi:hypothetical protein Tco_1501062 [Tanacetum coccineum]
MNPRSCLRWKPKGRIFSNVRLRWIPTGKLLNSCTGKVDSEPAHGSINTVDQASVLHGNDSFTSVSGLVFHQMTYDHNRSELGIHDHSNKPSSSKLVPKVVPLAVKTATSRQELELLFHHHIATLRTTGINPMIQPEPEDLPKDNPKLEIAVLSMSMLVKNKRSQDGKDDKDNDKGSKSRSQSMKEQAYNEDKDQEHSSLNDKSNLTDLMKECHQ